MILSLKSMTRKELQAEDFSYELPENKIAKYPLDDRNQSKLLVYKNGQIHENVFSSLHQYLPEDSVLIFNDTKVLSARLGFKKSTGASIEIFCLEPYNTTVEQALKSTKACVWQCLVGNLKRFKKKDTLELKIAGTTLQAQLVENHGQYVVVSFAWESGCDFATILEQAGKVPLPPYLKREAVDEDKENYQTVYARNKGAVAAPTAGLHFVEQQLNDLKNNGHQLTYLTLYVGAGTFRAVKATKLIDHEMHEERIVIHKSTIELLANKKGQMISVGTTSLRSLESMYWLAVKMHFNETTDILNVSQEDAYQLPQDWSWKNACDYLLKTLEERKLEEIDFNSSLFIMPGYEWKSINGLITNFHQPKSTLLALVSSWIGEDWKEVYKYALNNDFRFLSYGDSSLLLR